MIKQVLGNWLIVERDEAQESASDGGIILSRDSVFPDTYKVLQVGIGDKSKDGDNFLMYDIEVGDTVVAETYGEKPLKVNGKTVVFMPMTSVLAII